MFSGLFRRGGSNRRHIEPDQLLAVDVETTGLKPDKHHLVSIGWVPVNGRVIDLSAAKYFVVSGAQVGDSATLHGITDDDVARLGQSRERILDEFEHDFAGRKLLAHFVQMEIGFIGALFHEVRGHKWKLTEADVVDTFVLERRHMERMGTYPRGEDLRLARVRERYSLPAYSNHNALSDAIACAELYLALEANRIRS